MLGLRLLVLYLGEQDQTLFLESSQVIQIFCYWKSAYTVGDFTFWIVSLRPKAETVA